MANHNKNGVLELKTVVIVSQQTGDTVEVSRRFVDGRVSGENAYATGSYEKPHYD